MPEFKQQYYEIHTVVRDDIVVEGRLYAPDTVDDLAEWSGGSVETRDGEAVFVVPAGPVSPEAVAQLGDHVMRLGPEWWVEPAGSFTQRWHDAAAETPVVEPARLYAPFDIVPGVNPWH